MLKCTRSETETVLESTRDRLVIRWINDRWNHWIERSVAGRWTILVRSLDRSGPGTERPPSPVFQQLHLQESAEDTIQVLLVGQDDKHHYSGVLTVSETGSEFRVDSEIADRCPIAESPVASTFIVDLPITALSEASDTEGTWELKSVLPVYDEDPLEAALVIEAQSNGRIDVREATYRSLYVQVTPPRQQLSAPTRSWAFSWRVVERAIR